MIPSSAWAGGGEDFQYYVDVAQQQFAAPQQPYYPPVPEPQWYDSLDGLIAAFLELGWIGWAGLGCFAIGVITVGCFLIGRSKLFEKYVPILALLNRLFKTWSNLLKGK